VSVEETSEGFVTNKKNNFGNIYCYKQEAKTNEQIRLEFLKKTGTSQKSQPIPIPKIK